MSVSSSDQIVLSDGQRQVLLARARQTSGQHRDVLRARIVLAAADGASNAGIGRALGVCDDTVRKWRHRFCQHGMDGLCDHPRPGRPRRFSAAVVAEVKALACELPAKSDVPLAKWSCPDLAMEAIQRGVVKSVSASTVRRWLAADALKPWQYRSWIFPRDPHFAVKAARVLDLYARVWDGEPLSENDYVLSADEKPGVQARSHAHPSRPPGPGQRPMHVESEYQRHGTLAYLAAYDVHRAQVIGHCAPSTGIEPFAALVDKVMTREPYASARRVFWVVDNGASHRGWTAAARLTEAFRNATMIHLPVHASWLNQIEIYFSVVQRKLLTPDDFPNLDVLANQLTAFEERYNSAAQPFDWRFNRNDLNRLLTRIAA
ncbi:IS630 family transposase [Mycobacterium sp.]|uniref:IS630 family transposase n=1 Tax=Mycobacterium sp. TaxID=1785 RepID=UPI003F9D595B